MTGRRQAGRSPRFYPGPRGSWPLESRSRGYTSPSVGTLPPGVDPLRRGRRLAGGADRDPFVTSRAVGRGVTVTNTALDTHGDVAPPVRVTCVGRPLDPFQGVGEAATLALVTVVADLAAVLRPTGAPLVIVHAIAAPVAIALRARGALSSIVDIDCHRGESIRVILRDCAKDDLVDSGELDGQLVHARAPRGNRRSWRIPNGLFRDCVDTVKGERLEHHALVRAVHQLDGDRRAAITMREMTLELPSRGAREHSGRVAVTRRRAGGGSELPSHARCFRRSRRGGDANDGLRPEAGSGDASRALGPLRRTEQNAKSPDELTSGLRARDPACKQAGFFHKKIPAASYSPTRSP